MVRVVVVGGGIAGLTAAYEIGRRLPAASVTLLESSGAVGGKLRLGRVGGQQVDLGAEAMLNRRPEAVDLAREVGLADDLVYPETITAGVWTRGAVRRLPRTVMGVPADMDALAASGIVGAAGLARARAERILPPVAPLAEGDDIAIGALVAKRLGREVRDRLVEPLLGGVYAGRADELSLRATVPQLAAALGEGGRLLEVASSIAPAPPPAGTSPNPVFAGLRGGVGRLAVAVDEAFRAGGGEPRTGATVREVSGLADGRFRITLGPVSAPEWLEADAVVVAVPALPAARMLRVLAPQAAGGLAEIEYASMAIVTLAFEAAGAEGELVGSGLLVPPIEGREIKASTFSSRKWGWLSDELLVVRCSIGRLGDEAQLQRDDSDLVDAAAMDLRGATGLHARLRGAEVTRWGGALPQYTVGHVGRVSRIKAAIEAVPGLAVCGAAYDGLGIPACIGSARAAATRVVDHLGRQGTMPA